MKEILSYRFLMALTLLILVPIVFINCSSPKSASGSMSGSDAQWYKGQSWLGGLQMTPHESINEKEFSRQYHLNKKWWDEAFNFVKTHDLVAIAPGTYIIDSNNVYAIIAELDPNEKEQVKWEAHKNFNDLQFIIKGKAIMGIAQVSSPTATVNVPYDPEADIGYFNVSGEKYYDAEPGTFFIFSPNEMHRPAFKMAGYNSIKKIVVKVRVPK